MKKILIILISIFGIMNCSSQKEKNADTIYIDQLEKKSFYSMQNEGWVLIKSKSGEKYLANLSNKDYILYFSINCENTDQQPRFLIEYSNNYRDGNRGGLDFTSSDDTKFEKILMFIDDKKYDNPFQTYDKGNFSKFKSALKKGKLFTMKFYEEKFNPESGDDEITLNREIQFLLKNSQLLDVRTTCKTESSEETSTTEVINND